MLCICRRDVADGTAPAACRWALWDEFQIVEASMYGYWNASAPIKIADGHDVLATSWVRHDTPDVLVAIGSWNAGMRDTYSYHTCLQVDAGGCRTDDDGSINILLVLMGALISS